MFHLIKFLKKQTNITFLILLVGFLLSFVVWQSRMSNGMLIQLNIVVILVMTLNLNAMVNKVIAWQLDTLLLSSAKEHTSRISDTGLGT